MTQNAILFIPDISGFTEFVNHTEISHSRHIISELLELLIDNNTIGLELAEIEGDALFYYKLTDDISFETLEKQVHQMYLAFHEYLQRYKFHRICHCGACSSAYNLSLKFIVHYGEIEFITVKDHKKPYGSNVIVAHRLLKNDIEIKEYAIFTESVTEKKVFSNYEESEATYDFGNIKFIYKPLSELKATLPKVEPIPADVPKHKLISQTNKLQINILDLYEIISNFDYRLLWSKGINRLEYEKNKVNRQGAKHLCLLEDNKTFNVTTVTKPSEKDTLVYGESTTEFPFTKKFNTYFILKEIDDNTTQLTVESYADFNLLGIVMKPFLKKKIKKIFTENIKELSLLIQSGFNLNK